MTGCDGSHLSTARGFRTALDQAEALGVDAAQVWIQDNPWFAGGLTADERTAGRRLASRLPTLNHCSYDAALVHPLGSPVAQRVLQGIREQLLLSAALGMVGLVIHPGDLVSDLDLRRVVLSLRALSDVLGSTVPLLLENAAQGQHRKLGVLREVIERAGVEGVGICWDTAHAYGAGLDLADPELVTREVAAAGGHVRAVHFNNSSEPLGSGGDDHAALLDGLQTPEQVQRMYTHVVGALPRVPCIVETAEDPLELELMRRWRAGLAAPQDAARERAVSPG